MRRGVIVLFLALALLFILTTLATAEEVQSQGEVGTTEASLTSEVSTSSNASAASSAETGAVGAVDASAAWVGEAPSEDSDSDSGENVEVDNGGGSTTQIGQFSTSAEAQIDPDFSESIERVENVIITAPDGLPFDVLAKIDISQGQAHGALVDAFPEGAAFHDMGGFDTVFLFDNEGGNPANLGIIKFERGVAMVTSTGEGGVPHFDVSIEGLSIWDPNTEDYQNFGDFSSSSFSGTSTPPDVIAAALVEINTILALSNLKMLGLVEGERTYDIESDFTEARATLMRVVYPATGEPLLELILLSVFASANFETGEASARGTELSFRFTAPPPTEEQPTEQPPAEQPLAPQPEPQAAQPQAQPVQVAQAQPQARPTQQAQLPVTGFNYLWLLLGAGLVLTGLRLRRFRRI